MNNTVVLSSKCSHGSQILSPIKIGGWRRKVKQITFSDQHSFDVPWLLRHFLLIAMKEVYQVEFVFWSSKRKSEWVIGITSKIFQGWVYMNLVVFRYEWTVLSPNSNMPRPTQTSASLMQCTVHQFPCMFMSHQFVPTSASSTTVSQVSWVIERERSSPIDHDQEPQRPGKASTSVLHKA